MNEENRRTMSFNIMLAFSMSAEVNLHGAEQGFCVFMKDLQLLSVFFSDFDSLKKTCQTLTQKTYKYVHLPFAT
jgi:hypothetical protein